MPLSARQREILLDLKLIRDSGVFLGNINEESRAALREEVQLLTSEFVLASKEEGFRREQAAKEEKRVERYTRPDNSRHGP